MQGLENLNIRLQYHGGIKQEDRMIKDKERSLKKALLYSYQACTAILNDGREFRCLINRDKLKLDYDDKIISIPFADVPIGAEQGATEEVVNLQPGDVFEWKETNTFWIVYLRRYEEDAYFRAEIRRCRHEIKINDTIYRIYLAGPDKNDIAWHTRHQMGSWNDLDYNLKIFIQKNDETVNYFQRFKKVKIDNKPWEVQVVDSMSTEGILEIKLKEDFSNELEDEMVEVVKPEHDTILGEINVFPYEIYTYHIVGLSNGCWEVDNLAKASILKQDEYSVTLEIITGRSGKFNLLYKNNGQVQAKMLITIESL